MRRLFALLLLVGCDDLVWPPPTPAGEKEALAAGKGPGGAVGASVGAAIRGDAGAEK